MVKSQNTIVEDRVREQAALCTWEGWMVGPTADQKAVEYWRQARSEEVEEPRRPEPTATKYWTMRRRNANTPPAASKATR